MASYTRWSEGEPNNLFGVEDCVYWTSRGWLDADCYRNRQVDIYLQIVDRWNVAIVKLRCGWWRLEELCRVTMGHLRVTVGHPCDKFQPLFLSESRLSGQNMSL